MPWLAATVLSFVVRMRFRSRAFDLDRRMRNAEELMDVSPGLPEDDIAVHVRLYHETNGQCRLGRAQGPDVQVVRVLDARQL